MNYSPGSDDCHGFVSVLQGVGEDFQIPERVSFVVDWKSYRELKLTVEFT